MLVAFSVSPSGDGRADGSVHDAVAAVVRVVRESGLRSSTDSGGRPGRSGELTGEVEHLEQALRDGAAPA